MLSLEAHFAGFWHALQLFNQQGIQEVQLESHLSIANLPLLLFTWIPPSPPTKKKKVTWNALFNKVKLSISTFRCCNFNFLDGYNYRFFNDLLNLSALLVKNKASSLNQAINSFYFLISIIWSCLKRHGIGMCLEPQLPPFSKCVTLLPIP